MFDHEFHRHVVWWCKGWYPQAGAGLDGLRKVQAAVAAIDPKYVLDVDVFRMLLSTYLTFVPREALYVDIASWFGLEKEATLGGACRRMWGELAILRMNQLPDLGKPDLELP